MGLNLIVKMIVIVLEMKYCRGPGRCMGVPNPRARVLRGTARAIKAAADAVPRFLKGCAARRVTSGNLFS